MKHLCLALLSVLLLFSSTAAQTPCTGGMASIYPCDGVDLMSHMAVSAFTSPGTSAPSAANDIWGWTDSKTGNEYALVGLTNGTAFIDVTAPSSPVYLGKLPTATSNSSWRDIKTVGDYAFIVSEAGSHGMQVFDLTRLRNVVSPPVTFTDDARFTGFGSAHNIVADEDSGFVYAVGTSSCAGGLYMVNVATPLTPSFAGCYSGDGYTHDAQCVVYTGPDTDHTGKQICVALNEDTVTVVDVTNKNAPVQLARAFYPSPSYTHQGWFTADQRYLVVDDELDGNSSTPTRTIVMDMLDLDNPEFAFFHSGATNALDHNQYVHNGRIYQSNYTAGLRILDASGIAGGSLSEIAYFDTYPANDNRSFNGQWSNYPYFASGTILANDINNGFFALRMAGGDPIVLDVVASTGGGGTRARARLSWTPFDGAPERMRVLRNGVIVRTTLDDGQVNYREDPVPTAPIDYQVCDAETFECSNIVTATFFASPDPADGSDDAQTEGTLGAGAANAATGLPESAVLHRAYPNPFNPSTTLSFSMPEAAAARLSVFDSVGREVARLVDGTMEAGRHEVAFDASNLPSGVYLVRFETGTGIAQTQRLTLLK